MMNGKWHNDKMEISNNFLLIDYFDGFPNLSLSLSFMMAPSQAMGRFAASGHWMLTSLSGLNEGFNAVQNNYLTALLDGVLPSTQRLVYFLKRSNLLGGKVKRYRYWCSLWSDMFFSFITTIRTGGRADWLGFYSDRKWFAMAETNIMGGWTGEGRSHSD